MRPELDRTLKRIQELEIPASRKVILKPMVDYIQKKIDQGQEANLNFICTHNSRRSQFSQIWAQTAADHFGVPANCYSGGVEVTAFNERAVASIRRSGFRVSKQSDQYGTRPSQVETNPIYLVFHSDNGKPIRAFSKVFDDPENKAEQFAAVMTCSHADENCPFIPGTEQRIPVRYDDPKAFDGTLQEAAMYDERSMQIASEMFYVFSKIKLT